MSAADADQLIDATTGGHIWADRFEGNLGNVFDLQDRFTESVVAAIEPNLQLAEIALLIATTWRIFCASRWHAFVVDLP
jgi:hypothetical protein